MIKFEKADVFCTACSRHQRVEKCAEYKFANVETAFVGRCPNCGAWVFKIRKLSKTA